MFYFYNRKKFSTGQRDEINDAIFDKIDKESFKIMTMIKDGKPVFNAGQMKVIRDCAHWHGTIDFIKYFTKLNNNNEPIYDANQMRNIWLGLKYLPKECVEIFAKLNEMEKPIFNTEQMKEIRDALEFCMPEEIINLITKLDSNLKPFFDHEQMDILRYAYFLDNIKENIDIIAKIEDDKLLSTTEDMRNFVKFFTKADEEKIKQLRECDKIDIPFSIIKTLIYRDSPISVIRMSRSLYNSGIDENSVNFFLNRGYNYDQLKDIKYMIGCVREISKKSDFDLYKNSPNTKVYRVVSSGGNSFSEWAPDLEIEEYRRIAAVKIAKGYGLDVRLCEFVENCLSEKMQPDEIKIAIDKNFGIKEKDMEDILSKKEKQYSSDDIEI
jgi:hypothetical protein